MKNGIILPWNDFVVYFLFFLKKRKYEYKWSRLNKIHGGLNLDPIHFILLNPTKGKFGSTFENYKKNVYIKNKRQHDAEVTKFGNIFVV